MRIALRRSRASAGAAPAPAETPAFRETRCPPDVANCKSATGEVLFVERIDPDGDGDAHFVIAGGDVTALGTPAIDVRRDLRPDPLPEPGDVISAAGPVYRGSYGQRQIEAEVVRVAPDP